MNRYHLTSILLFFLGFIFISISVIQGEGEVALLLFIPIFYGSGIYSFFGIVCIIVAIFLAFFGYALRFKWDLVEEEPIDKISLERRSMKKRFGGVVLIGPIPIIIGSDTKLVIIALLLAVVLVIATFFLFYWR
jgi:uncharacterized protein (TIGR00304 family)